MTQATWLNVRDHYPSSMKELPQDLINNFEITMARSSLFLAAFLEATV